MTQSLAVCERLLAWPAVVALVGQEVYQVLLPQSPVLPAIRVQLVGRPRIYHLRGGVDLSAARVQTDAYARQGSGTDALGDAAALADAIEAAISGQRWYAGGTPPQLQVLGAFCLDRRDGWEGDELGQARVIQDWRIWARTV